METEWLTTQQAAELLGIDASSVRQMIRGGLIRARRVEHSTSGNHFHYRIPPSEIEALLQRRATTSFTDSPHTDAPPMSPSSFQSEHEEVVSIARSELIDEFLDLLEGCIRLLRKLGQYIQQEANPRR